MRNLLVATALTCACVFSVTPTVAQDAPDASTVLAIVDGTEITLGHVILLRTQLPEQYLSAPDDVLFEGIIEQLIDQTVLSGTVPEESLEIRLTLENEKRVLYAGAAIDKILGAGFTDAEYQTAYDIAYGDFPEDPEFNASHILVETAEEAEALIVSLDGGADFAELAKEKSTGPSGPNGGELGWFGMGMMVAPFEAAVLELEAGEISGVVQTQFGFHVLILNEKRNKPAPTLEEVKDALDAEMQQERLNSAVVEMRKGVSVEILTDGIDPAIMRNLDLVTK